MAFEIFGSVMVAEMLIADTAVMLAAEGALTVAVAEGALSAAAVEATGFAGEGMLAEGFAGGVDALTGASLAEVTAAGVTAAGVGSELASGIMNSGLVDVAGTGLSEFAGLTNTLANPVAEKGLFASGLDWVGKNKTAANMIGQTFAGAVQGAGAGIGAQQAAKTAAQGAKDRIEQEAAQKLATSREGTYSGGIGVAPSANGILYTKEGKPVYVPGAVGIINQPRKA